MTVLKNALAVNDGKAVVISIKREWLAKIMSGEKTLEVRKSRPWEISFPFAVFCYETKANGGAGEIIGAFTCEDIDHLKRAPQSWQYINLNADDIESVAAASE